jgi:IPT/TIG domain
MDETRRGACDAGACQARRPVSAILALAGAVLFAVASVGCGHGTGVRNMAAPAALGNSGSGCPTHGVGGDALAPPCAAQGGAPAGGTNAGGPAGGTNGASGPAGISTSPNQAVAPPITPSSGVGPSTPSGQGISGPATPTPPPPTPPDTAPPQVTAISPASGPTSGGSKVLITGSGFTGATAVDFGGVSAVIMMVDSDTEITATSPPGTGAVDVTVVTPNGASATGPADQFSYAG